MAHSRQKHRDNFLQVGTYLCSKPRPVLQLSLRDHPSLADFGRRYIAYLFSDTVKGDYAVDGAVMVSKPVYRSMRLVRVEMGKHRIWSFISVGWGLLSDIGKLAIISVSCSG